MTASASAVGLDQVHHHIQWVKNCIEHCIAKYMNEEQTINYLSSGPGRISPYVASMLWRWLRESNPEFFNEYALRLQLLGQIKTFNALLNKQAQYLRFINNQQQPPPLYDPNLYCDCKPPPQPVSSFDQNFGNSGDGQLTQYPDMAVPDASPSYPSRPLNGPSHTGNNMNTPSKYMVPVPNSNLPHELSNRSSFVNQNYPCAFMSSTIPVNGNMPQLPMMHDSSTFPSSRNLAARPYTYLIEAYTSSLTNDHSPMNTEDENEFQV